MAATLYPGIPFSPQAILTNNIGAADSIIEVSDVSAFPPAPNLATIGTDEEGETILYTAKTGTALSGCQRGIEGTARAWTSGELIGRNFTAKDHADLIAAVTEIRGAATTAQETAAVAGAEAREARDAAQDAQTMAEDAQSAAEAASTALEEHSASAAAHGDIREEVAGKQDLLTGRPGQVVGFDGMGLAYAAQGWSNPNLLDNWYFADPVNQRGQTEYSTAGYAIDRWLFYSGATKQHTLTVGDGCISLVSGGTNNPWIRQKLEGRLDPAKKVTLSILAKSNVAGTSDVALKLSNLDDLNIGTIKWFQFSKPDVYELFSFVTNPYERSSFEVIGSSAAGRVDDILAVKLELGSVQTLAHQDADGNWVLNDPPPNKAEELLKCQRYFEVSVWNVAVAIAKDTNTLTSCGTYYYKVKKRIVPAVTVSSGTADQKIIVYDPVTSVYITGLNALPPTSRNTDMFSPKIYDPQSRFVIGRTYQVEVPDVQYWISADL